MKLQLWEIAIRRRSCYTYENEIERRAARRAAARRYNARNLRGTGKPRIRPRCSSCGMPGHYYLTCTEK